MGSSISVENFRTEYLMNTLKIEIPGRRNSNELFLLTSWLIYWLLILILIITAFVDADKISNFVGIKSLTSATAGMRVVLSFSLFFWGARGIFGLYAFLWKIAGLDTLEANHSLLKIKKSIFGIGQEKEIPQSEIIRIKYKEPTTFPLAFLKFKFARFDIQIVGPIAISMKGKTQYFGLGLEREQAEKLVDMLQKQLSLINHA